MLAVPIETPVSVPSSSTVTILVLLETQLLAPVDVSFFEPFSPPTVNSMNLSLIMSVDSSPSRFSWMKNAVPITITTMAMANVNNLLDLDGCLLMTSCFIVFPHLRGGGRATKIEVAPPPAANPYVRLLKHHYFQLYSLRSLFNGICFIECGMRDLCNHNSREQEGGYTYLLIGTENDGERWIPSDFDGSFEGKRVYLSLMVSRLSGALVSIPNFL